MTTTILSSARLAGIASAVPAKSFDNIKDTSQFDPVDVKKVVAMAGVKQRKVSDGSICSTDLCLSAGQALLKKLNWAPDSVQALIFITQTPDYFLPGSASLIHNALNLPDSCAAFDVGLGCSGYPYGLWLAHMMIQTGSARRILLMHGETPSLFTHKDDRSTYLLFGDGGSATALEFKDNAPPWGYSLHSDGKGYNDLIIPSGGFRDRHADTERNNYLHMNGANLFNFTVKRVPELIESILTLMERTVDDTDLFVFHQSNQFIMKHIAKKCKLPAEKIPLTLDRFGNTGGASVPLTLTHYLLENSIKDLVKGDSMNAMLLGYGVGLSWAAAHVTLDEDIVSLHLELEKPSLELHAEAVKA